MYRPKTHVITSPVRLAAPRSAMETFPRRTRTQLLLGNKVMPSMVLAIKGIVVPECRTREPNITPWASVQLRISSAAGIDQLLPLLVTSARKNDKSRSEKGRYSIGSPRFLIMTALSP